MKHVIIGTAGHVDHGKTVLVKALTGTDTDRLAEEKRRGITIEPGFARLDWPDGTQAGIVDVPGHEKFIKNMLAGAGGIDLAMLVIAADEGVMPQTVEHLDILSLLGVQGGLVVLTKAELVDDDWLEFVRRQALELTEGTFLEGAPILSVSAVTGQGIPELRDALYRLVQEAREKSALAPFRLPIDRVFSVDGFGTVVTGTLTEGVIRVGDPVELTPSGLTSRVRNIQVHGQNTETAYAGQRAALNLPSLKKEELHRGDAAVKPGSVRPSRMLDVRLRCLPDAHRTILSGSQVHLYHGASVRLAKAVLLDRDELPPGAQCFAQLRLTEPLAARQELTLSLDLPEHPIPSVTGDEEKLMQLLSILLSNALSYTPKGGSITIRLKTQGRAHLLSVEDTGIGITKEDQPHIFDRFYRTEKSRSTKGHFGLGLSIAYEIVTAHGGKIEVEDNTPNGSIFTVTL